MLLTYPDSLVFMHMDTFDAAAGYRHRSSLPRHGLSELGQTSLCLGSLLEQSFTCLLTHALPCVSYLANTSCSRHPVQAPDILFSAAEKA